MKEWTKLLLIVAGFLIAYYTPWDHAVIRQSGLEAFMMLQDYAREHVLTCLVPAFFIAGAIAAFVSQASVLKYFGAKANKILSYSVASVSGTVLAVCSCTVLPLFAGIHTRGAGIGPATAFLYSGPAINVLAIILTARVLGWQIGLARAVGAVVFSVVAGLLMAYIFRKEDAARDTGDFILPEDDCKQRSLTQEAFYLLTMVLILIFAAFARPAQGETGFWPFIFSIKWYITAALLIVLGIELKLWFTRSELTCWMETTWQFVKQIVPLLAGGVLIAGFLLGRPGLRGPDPGALHPRSRGGKFALGQFLRRHSRGLHVLRNPDGGAHPPGPHRVRHGPGTGTGPPSGGAGFIPAQHDRPCGDHGGQKDLHVLHDRGGAGHDNRHRLRLDHGIECYG